MTSNIIVNDFLKGTNVYLIGMMGAGKSTVGQQLAKRLSYRFADTDTIIEQAAGPIADLFANEGESAFRELETQVLSQLAPYTRMAIATGGGIIIERKNWSYLQHGVVVWLDTPTEVLLERLSGDRTRPLLQAPDPQKVLETLLNQRRSLYAQADVTVAIQASQSPDQVCDQILDGIQRILRPEQLPAAPPEA